MEPPPPVEEPVTADILAEEAEAALLHGEQAAENTGSAVTVEFYYGKVKGKDGSWKKTGKVYWICTYWITGKRYRVSPSKIYGDERGITSIEKCPYPGRVIEFYRRSLSFSSSALATTGAPGAPGGLQDSQG